MVVPFIPENPPPEPVGEPPFNPSLDFIEDVTLPVRPLATWFVIALVKAMYKYPCNKTI